MAQTRKTAPAPSRGAKTSAKAPTPAASSMKAAVPAKTPRRGKAVASPPAAAVSATPLSKQAQMLALLRSPAGADITDLMAATGWQAHSVRGVISGVLRRRLGLQVLCTGDAGSRVYRIVEGSA